MAVRIRAGVHLQIAREHRCGEAGTRAAVDVEADVDLLVVGRVSQSKTGWMRAAEEAVAFEQALLRGNCLLQLRVGIGFAQVEVAGVLELPGVRRAGQFAAEPRRCR